MIKKSHYIMFLSAKCTKRETLLRQRCNWSGNLRPCQRPLLLSFPSLFFQVTNLPHPYKTNCGMPKLKFFDTYSKSKCFLDKLTRYVTKLCKCRDWFMPGKVVINGGHFEQMIRVLDPRSRSGRSYHGYCDVPLRKTLKYSLNY